MNIWIDVEVAEQIPFIKSLSDELKQRGHFVTITACDSEEIKSKLNEYVLQVKIIGKKNTFFGLFNEQSDLIRFTSLADYIEKRKINIAFSLGSKPMVVTCNNLNLSIALFLESPRDNVDWLHYSLEKSYFIVQHTITEQQIIKQNINPKKVARIDHTVSLKETTISTRAIKDIANKIEMFSSFKDIKA